MKILSTMIAALLVTGCATSGPMATAPIYCDEADSTYSAVSCFQYWQAVQNNERSSYGYYAAASGRNSSLNVPAQPGGIDRYGLDQATGPVTNGVHHGIPAGPPRVTCHGAIVGGTCTGPEY